MKAFLMSAIGLFIFVENVFAAGGLQQQIPPAEYNALLVLYNSMNGASWTNHTGWTDGSAPNWFGVTVQQGHVDRLNLNANNLAGIIPPAIGQLTQLTSLDFGHSNLAGPIPVELGQLSSLRQVYLYDGKLTGTILSQIGQLTQLLTFSVSANRLTGGIPASVGQLSQLQELDVDNNLLSGLIPSQIGQIRTLRRFSASRCQFAGAIPASLGQLTNLDFLDLSSNRLSGGFPQLAMRSGAFGCHVENNYMSIRDSVSQANITQLKNSGVTVVTEPQLFPGAIATKLQHQVAGDGSVTLVLTTKATGVSYQWSFNGSRINGATQSMLAIGQITSGTAGRYSVTVRNPYGLVGDRSITLRVPGPPERLLNISTRMQIQTGDNVLIGGFIIIGSGQKKVIVRAIGPSLAAVGISGALQDPTLELHDPTGATIATNDNWKDSQEQEIRNTGIPPQDDRESAIVTSLPAGAYTAVVRGKNNTTGVGLVEVYDLDQIPSTKLANISTRGPVQAGENVMIGGFILGGTKSSQLTIRALGPSLNGAGVAGVLPDPMLELHDSAGAVVASNDNWEDTQRAEIQASGIAPSNDAESALITALRPSAYTAVVRGSGGQTGIGLVEVYRRRFQRRRSG